MIDLVAAQLLLPALLAHGGKPHGFADLPFTWSRDPLSWAALALSGWLYAIGLRRTWRASRVGAGIRPWHAGCFAAGWAALFVALVSPIHPWGQVLFSVHMTQHEILMVIAAPLMVLGRPMAAMLRALPPRWAHGLARGSNRPAWQCVWSAISNPVAAWAIHFVALWMWHIPSLFEATLHSEWVHAAQHLCFFGSALLFWWAVVEGSHRALGYGAAVMYLFSTALHSGVLGALLAFTSTLLYPGYAHTTQSWGLTPVQDQQLGGLIMWIPAGIVYVIAALALAVAWLRESEQRALRRERRAVAALMWLLVASAALALGGGGCKDADVANAAASMTGGDPARGKAAMRSYGCISCHTVPGLAGDARTAPPLTHMAQRTFVAGIAKNTPDNLARWIQEPTAMDPQTGMPDLHVTPQDARDIAAYLYTLE